MRGENLMSHFFHSPQSFLCAVETVTRVAESDDEMICSRCAAVRLEYVLQPLLCADVLLWCYAEVRDRNGCGQVNSGKQPADCDGEKPQNTEENEQTSRAPGDTNNQYSAQEQQER